MHKNKTLAEVEAKDPNWIYKFVFAQDIAKPRPGPELHIALQYHLMSLISPPRRDQPGRG